MVQGDKDEISVKNNEKMRSRSFVKGVLLRMRSCLCLFLEKQMNRFNGVEDYYKDT